MSRRERFAAARRLAKWALVALMACMACTASHARDEKALVGRWKEKLDAAFASVSREAGAAYPAPMTRAEIATATYDSEKDRAVNILDVTLLDELRFDLAAIVRVPAPRGFKNEPSFNLYTLIPQRVDLQPPFGLNFPATDGRGAAFVTHRLLLDDWLQRKRSSRFEIVNTLKAALETSVLFQSVFEVQRVMPLLSIPTPTDAAGAAALLVSRGHDAADRALPSDIVVALVQDDRLVMALMPLEAPLPTALSCAASARKLEARKKRPVDAERRFQACYSQAIAGRPELAQATRQAQALLDRLGEALATHRSTTALP